MKQQLLEFYRSRANSSNIANLDFIDKSEVFDREYDFSPSPIMLIGEAPGQKEAEEGRPFCGAAGKNLAALLEFAKLDRKKILITNAFAFRTIESSSRGFKNRTPNSNELSLGADMLLAEINIVKPFAIILLGASAEKAICKSKDLRLSLAFKKALKHEISEVSMDGGERLLIAKTYHPSPLVFNMPAKRAKLYDFFDRLSGLGQL